MRIADSNVTLSAATSSVEKYNREESLKTWTGNQRPDFEGVNSGKNQSSVPLSTELNDILQLSEEGKKALQNSTSINTAPVGDTDSISLELSDKDKLKLRLIEKMLEALTGKKIKLRTLDKIDMKTGNAECDSKTLKVSQQAAGQNVQRAGWGMEYDLHESYYEKQTLSFSADGVVKTADGREIKFSLDLNMSREFASRTDISIRAGDAVKVDPLVINLDSNAPSLTQEKYSFDIDNDGDSDQISFVSGGSGFLAIDSNGDGIINNGSELFGPQSGNGFSDLAEYDTDGNSWIDEGDAVYDKLRIWTKDENGNDQLLALGEQGVGAIYLGNVGSAFSLKDSSNALQGEIAKTGIYLNENGTAGTIQHIDLAI